MDGYFRKRKIRYLLKRKIRKRSVQMVNDMDDAATRRRTDALDEIS